MRLINLRLKGFKGIEVGLSLYEINIDMRNSFSNIVLICGKNGSGKSTINKASSPLPDSINELTPGKYAEKEATYFDNGEIIVILVKYPISENGERKQTKAFIKKNNEELNPNGNITSYKEIIFNEFELDPNFMALTRLASDDKGLAEKTPAERKKYVSYTLSSLDTFNNMQKTFSKKASIFRSHINSLHSKIMSNGNLDSANLSFKALTIKINNIENTLRSMQDEITGYKFQINSADPTGSIQNDYNEIVESISSVNSLIEVKQKSLDILFSKMNIDRDADINKMILNCENQHKSVQESLTDDRIKLRNLVDGSVEMARSLELKTQKLDSLNGEFDYNELLDKISYYENIIKKQEDILRECGLLGVSISKEEYLLIFNKMQYYRNGISSATSYIDNELLELSINLYIKEGRNIKTDISVVEERISENEKIISNSREKISYYEALFENTKILSKRPEKCKIDSCEFIKQALDSLAQKPEENISLNRSIIESSSLEIQNDNDSLSKLRLMENFINQLMSIMNDIESNKMILSKFNDSYIFIDKDEFLNRIINGNTFNEVENCSKYILLADSISDYADNQSILDKLRNEKLVHESKHKLIEEITNDINELSDKISNANDDITRYNRSINASTGILSNLENTQASLLKISDELLAMDELLAQKASIKNKYLEIKDNISKIKDMADKVNSLQSTYNSMLNELTPMKEDKDQLAFNIKKAEEYQEELELYQAKYDKIDKLKKHASQSGIQSIFMDIYMNKTLTMANELLSYMFHGELQLLPYIINEEEFRIPVIHSSGLVTDDISSCSGAEVAMATLAVGLSLLMQASPKYNIVRLDEIDHALDISNKMQFSKVLKDISEKLGIEQIFMISHSIELETGSFDLIKLVMDTMYDIEYSGNTIYDWKKDVGRCA